VDGHYDALETQDPEERERALFRRLPAQIEHARAHAPYYARVLASVGLPELVGRAPDHVAFSDGVTTRFGLPRDARSPRR